VTIKLKFYTETVKKKKQKEGRKMCNAIADLLLGGHWQSGQPNLLQKKKYNFLQQYFFQALEFFKKFGGEANAWFIRAPIAASF
jgi:hypothetical protein